MVETLHSLEVVPRGFLKCDRCWTCYCWTTCFPKRRVLSIKGAGAAGAVSYPCLRRRNPNFFKPLACSPCSCAPEIWPASSRPHAAADGT
jgi:hypothetical protein